MLAWSVCPPVPFSHTQFEGAILIRMFRSLSWDSPGKPNLIIFECNPEGVQECALCIQSIFQSCTLLGGGESPLGITLSSRDDPAAARGSLALFFFYFVFTIQGLQALLVLIAESQRVSKTRSPCVVGPGGDLRD